MDIVENGNKSNAHCKLYFRYGPMNSGKSLFLCSTAYNFKERGIPFLILKPCTDTRDKGNFIKSRALSTKFPCELVPDDLDIFSFVRDLKKRFQWILVDESQFLKPEQVDQLAQIVDELQINVICYGLRTDFMTKLFPGSQRLFEVADTLEEFKSSCCCGRRASVNARIDNSGKIVREGEQVLCGAEDTYVTLCRCCYNKMIRNNLSLKDLR